VTTDRSRGPRVGNGRITVEVEAGTASDLEVEVGSMGFRNLGQVVPKTRPKTFPIETSVDTTGAWEPVAAVRIQPSNFLVTSDLRSISPTVTPSDAKFMTVAVDPSKTDASNFAIPDETNGLASSIEATTDVTQIPDTTGTLQTSTNQPGGYQITWSSTDVQGQGATATTSSAVREELRRLHDTDIGVVLVKADSTGSVEFEVNTLQEK
jgi:hypothetical protein